MLLMGLMVVLGVMLLYGAVELFFALVPWFLVGLVVTYVGWGLVISIAWLVS